MTSKPRKWWIAGLLTLVEPGLGQVYNGQGLKGALILALPILIIPGLILSLDTGNMLSFVGGFVLLTMVLYVASFADAVLTARRLSHNYRLKRYNRAAYYLGIVALVMVVSTILTGVVKNNFVKAYRIPTASMEPTLLVGDHILVDRRASALDPLRWDLIVYQDPTKPTREFVKRVVARGGETVEIRDKELFIDGQAVQETYVLHKQAEVIPAGDIPRDNFGPVTVPPGSYFVLGDNRDESLDSRFTGFVEKSRVKGTVRKIYWSWDARNNRVRWDRIGMEVN